MNFAKQEEPMALPVVAVTPKQSKPKYYQNFDFFFKRSCFRVMTEFYKDKFNAYYAKRMTQLKQSNF